MAEPSLEAQVDDLRRMARSLQEAQRIAHLGSWDWDIATGGLWWSDEVYRIFGRTPGTNAPSYDEFLSSVHPDDRETVTTAIGHAITTDGAPYSIQHRIVMPDGSVRHVHEIGEVTWEDGTAVRMLGTVLDVTDRVEREEALHASRAATREALERSRQLAEAQRAAADRIRELDRQKRQFLTALSHELRTPLTVVTGVAETLTRLDDEDATTRGLLVERLLRHAAHLNDLISDLLVVAAPDQPRPAQLSALDLADLVRDVATTLSSSSGHAVRLTLASAPTVVDARAVRRAVHALIDNALRYGDSEHPVEVSLERGDDTLELTVSDRGPGIPDALRRQIFEPFARGGRVIAHSPGVGIGLTVAQRCAEAHGGEVWLGTRDGGGTSVRLTLPARVEDEHVQRLRRLGLDRAL